MRSFLSKTWPLLLLLLAAQSSWAVDHRVTVGGTASGGPYGGGGTPVLMFNPSNLTINAGDTVTFVNAGGPHNVHADDESFRCANGCDGAGGNGTPSSDSWTSTVTFNQAGTFNYHCDIHGPVGMTGTITVQGTQPSGFLPITGGFTGTWFNRDQSGHGIVIEVIPNNQFLAWWFSFNPDGTEQAWFGNVGTIEGDTATVNALRSTGGRWIPNFDPSTVTQVPWGTLTFHFTDCNHGGVDFDATESGFGTGHMDLERLTQPIGAVCP